MPSPLIKEKFSRSKRHGTRPSTVSSLSFLGSERSPRFYEKVVRWFRRKRGKEFGGGSQGGPGGCSDQTVGFPTEKHSNAHHKAVFSTQQHQHQQGLVAATAHPSINGYSKGVVRLQSGASRTLAYHHQLSGSIVSSGSEFGSTTGIMASSPRSTPGVSHKLPSVTSNIENSTVGTCGNSYICNTRYGRAPLSSTTSTVSNNSLAAPGLSLASGSCIASAGGGTIYPNPCLNSARGLSMESGYQSFSTCSSPANSQASPSMYKRTDRSSRFRFLARAFKSVRRGSQHTQQQQNQYLFNQQQHFKPGQNHQQAKSLSVDAQESVGEQQQNNRFWSHSMPHHTSSDELADGRRRLFQAKTAVFHSAVDEEEAEIGGSAGILPSESRSVK